MVFSLDVSPQWLILSVQFLPYLIKWMMDQLFGEFEKDHFNTMFWGGNSQFLTDGTTADIPIFENRTVGRACWRSPYFSIGSIIVSVIVTEYILGGLNSKLYEVKFTWFFPLFHNHNRKRVRTGSSTFHREKSHVVEIVDLTCDHVDPWRYTFV